MMLYIMYYYYSLELLKKFKKKNQCSSQVSILLVHVPRLGMHGCLATQLVGVLGLYNQSDQLV